MGTAPAAARQPGYTMAEQLPATRPVSLSQRLSQAQWGEGRGLARRFAAFGKGSYLLMSKPISLAVQKSVL